MKALLRLSSSSVTSRHCRAHIWARAASSVSQLTCLMLEDGGRLEVAARDPLAIWRRYLHRIMCDLMII